MFQTAGVRRDPASPELALEIVPPSARVSVFDNRASPNRPDSPESIARRAYGHRARNARLPSARFHAGAHRATPKSAGSRHTPAAWTQSGMKAANTSVDFGVPRLRQRETAAQGVNAGERQLRTLAEWRNSRVRPRNERSTQQFQAAAPRRPKCLLASALTRRYAEYLVASSFNRRSVAGTAAGTSGTASISRPM